MDHNKLKGIRAILDLVEDQVTSRKISVSYHDSRLPFASARFDPVTLTSHSLDQAIVQSKLSPREVYREQREDPRHYFLRDLKRTSATIDRILEQPSSRAEKELRYGLEMLSSGLRTQTIRSDFVFEAIPETESYALASFQDWDKRFRVYNTTFEKPQGVPSYDTSKYNFYKQTLESLLVLSYLTDLHNYELTDEKVHYDILKAYDSLSTYVKKSGKRGASQKQEALELLQRARESSQGVLAQTLESVIHTLQTETIQETSTPVEHERKKYGRIRSLLSTRIAKYSMIGATLLALVGIPTLEVTSNTFSSAAGRFLLAHESAIGNALNGRTVNGHTVSINPISELLNDVEVSDAERTEFYHRLREHNVAIGGKEQTQALAFNDQLRHGIGYYNEDGELLKAVGTTYYTYRQIMKIAPVLPEALVAIEDRGSTIPYVGRFQDFWSHKGFNFLSFTRAVLGRVFHYDAGGGSTLTNSTIGVLREVTTPDPIGKLEEIAISLKLEQYLIVKNRKAIDAYRTFIADSTTHANSRNKLREFGLLEHIPEKAEAFELARLEDPSTDSSALDELAQLFAKREILELSLNHYSGGMDRLFDIIYKLFPDYSTLNPTDQAIACALLARSIQAPTVYVTRPRQFFEAEEKIKAIDIKLAQVPREEIDQREKLLAERSSLVERSNTPYVYQANRYRGKEFFQTYTVPGVRYALQKMLELGTLPNTVQTELRTLNPSQLDDRIAQVLETQFREGIRREQTGHYFSPWYEEASLDEIARMVIDHPEGKITPKEREHWRDVIRTSGIRVVVSYREEIQEKLEAAVSNEVLKKAALTSEGLRAIAGGSVFLGTNGQVFAVVGDVFYGKQDDDERWMNTILDGKYSVSSTIKPSLLGLALERGLSPHDLIINPASASIERDPEGVFYFTKPYRLLPRTWDQARALTRNRRLHDTIESWDHRPSPLSILAQLGEGTIQGYTTLQELLGASRNPHAVAMYRFVRHGYEKKHLALYGYPLSPNNPEYLAANAIGDNPERLLDVARVNLFAVQNTKKEGGLVPKQATFIQSITDADGNILYQAPLREKQFYVSLCSPQHAEFVHNAMRAALLSSVSSPQGRILHDTGTAYGSFNAAYPTPAKTGTMPNDAGGFALMIVNDGLIYSTLMNRSVLSGRPTHGISIHGADAMHIAHSFVKEHYGDKPVEMIARYREILDTMSHLFIPVSSSSSSELSSTTMAVAPSAEHIQNIPGTLHFTFQGQSYRLKEGLEPEELYTALDLSVYAVRGLNQGLSTRLRTPETAGLSERAEFYKTSVASALASYHRALEVSGALLPVIPEGVDPDQYRTTINGKRVPVAMRPTITVDDVVNRDLGIRQPEIHSPRTTPTLTNNN